MTVNPFYLKNRQRHADYGKSLDPSRHLAKPGGLATSRELCLALRKRVVALVGKERIKRLSVTSKPGRGYDTVVKLELHKVPVELGEEYPGGRPGRAAFNCVLGRRAVLWAFGEQLARGPGVAAFATWVNGGCGCSYCSALKRDASKALRDACNMTWDSQELMMEAALG